MTNKLLTTAAILAVSTSFAGAKNFSGFGAGIMAGTTEVKVDGADSNTTQSALEVFGTYGQTFSSNVYVGGQLSGFFNKNIKHNGAWVKPQVALTGRLGYVFADKYMPYIFAGIARVSASVNENTMTDNDLAKTYGAGIEGAITDNVTLRGEYAMIKPKFNFGGSDADVKMTSWKLGVSYAF